MSVPLFPSLSDCSGWESIREAIRSGRVLAIPLEYSWCLAQSPLAASSGPLWTAMDSGATDGSVRASSLSSVHRIKRRPANKPFLYMAGSLTDILPFAVIPSSPWCRIWIDAWPAFLTLVLPAKPLAVSLGMSRNGGVAFRIPRDPALRSFLSCLKTPITGTSLNISGYPPLVSMEEILSVFPDIDGIVSSEDKDARRISPIVDLSKGRPFVVRPAGGLFPICDLRYRRM